MLWIFLLGSLVLLLDFCWICVCVALLGLILSTFFPPHPLDPGVFATCYEGGAILGCIDSFDFLSTNTRGVTTSVWQTNQQGFRESQQILRRCAVVLLSCVCCCCSWDYYCVLFILLSFCFCFHCLVYIVFVVRLIVLLRFWWLILFSVFLAW